MSEYTIKNAALTVRISTKGAEMQSILDRDGVERLWQGDPAYWTGRAPILFPVCGGFKEDAYYLDGVRYTMPKHGFARRAEWALESCGEDSAVFLMQEQHSGFPFRYELRACYQLDENRIRITYRVKNLDDKTFWFSIGSHEAWAIPGPLEKCTVEFEYPERLEHSCLDGNLLNGETQLIAENAKALPLKTEYFSVDALVFRNLKSRSVTLKNGVDSRAVRVDYEGMDVLMLWTKPGAKYLCIEPWCNAPDFADTDMQIAHKPGCICLHPGEEAERTHTATFL